MTVVGGGFAGLYAARNLGIDPEVRFTLVVQLGRNHRDSCRRQVPTWHSASAAAADLPRDDSAIVRTKRNDPAGQGRVAGRQARVGSRAGQVRVPGGPRPTQQPKSVSLVGTIAIRAAGRVAARCERKALAASAPGA